MRSPDGAERNPRLPRGVDAAPDFAVLHPGYARWSIFKRSVIVTFNNISKKYLPLYVAEFQVRYNNRENTYILGTAIDGC
jgi:transposase-like protein